MTDSILSDATEVRVSGTRNESPVGAVVRSAAAGDQMALANLLQRHQRLVIATARPLASDYHEACDVAPDALLQASEKLYTLKHPERFPGWQVAIVRNVAKQRRRTRRRRRSRERAASGDRSNVMAPPVCPDDELLVAIGRLTEAERTAVVLHYFEFQTPEQIAVLTGSTRGAVTKRLSRAVARLRQLLPDDRHAES